MPLNPINDLCMVKLDNQGPFSANTKETAEGGILLELPDKFNFFGFWSFSFESSFMEEEKLNKLYTYWESKIGRRIHWTALSERGNILENEDGKFAFVKLTSLIAEDDPESSTRNVHEDGQGSFGMEQ